MFHKSINTVLFVCATSMVFNTALADTTFKIKSSDGDDSVLLVKDGMGRMNTAGESAYMVFDSKTSVTAQVNPDSGSYMEITQEQLSAQMDQVKSSMAPEMEELKKQMATMDPQTRKMMEQKMGGFMGDTTDKTPPKPKLVPQGNKTIAGMKCRQNKMLSNGKHVGDVCVMEAAGGKISKQDYATIVKMMKAMMAMAKSADSMMGEKNSEDILAAVDLAGFPLALDDKQGGSSFTVQSVSNDQLPKALFTSYKKMKKQQMSDMFN